MEIDWQGVEIIRLLDFGNVDAIAARLILASTRRDQNELEMR